MNDSCWDANYSQYRSSIGYDIKRVKLACWPPNTARDIEFKKELSSHSDLCDRCVRLKWQLAVCKKSSHELLPSDRLTRQSTSFYPFQYLSPHSKKIKLDNMCQTIHKTTSKKAQEVDRLSMPDSQSSVIAEVVQTIHNTEQGQNLLQQIFSQADQSSEGQGELLKEIWDRDVSDINQFSWDQKKRYVYWSMKTCTMSHSLKIVMCGPKHSTIVKLDIQ